MPKITVHGSVASEQQDLVFDANAGDCLLDVLLDAGIPIEHACDKAGACGTCHVHVRSGADSLVGPDDLEEDGLDAAWGLDTDSRLSCRTVVGDGDLVIEVPRYTRNLAAERG